METVEGKRKKSIFTHELLDKVRHGERVQQEEKSSWTIEINDSGFFSSLTYLCCACVRILYAHRIGPKLIGVFWNLKFTKFSFFSLFWHFLPAAANGYLTATEYYLKERVLRKNMVYKLYDNNWHLSSFFIYANNEWHWKISFGKISYRVAR